MGLTTPTPRKEARWRRQRPVPGKVDVRLPGKGNSWKRQLTWLEAGPTNHHDDKVDSDQ